MRSQFIGLAGLAMIAAAACTPSVADKDASDVLVVPPPVVTTPVARGNPEVTLPLARYVATDDQRALVERAYLVLVDRCMSRSGFPPRFIESTSSRPKSTPVSWRYGVHDRDLATRYGYHMPPEYRVVSGLAEGATNGKMLARTMPEAEKVVHSSCVGEARRKLSETADGKYLDDVLAQSLGVVSFDHSLKDSRVGAAIAGWASCMRVHGFDVANVLDAAKRFDLAAPEPTGPEIKMARADVDCKDQSNLVGIWYAVELAYQHALIRANVERLEAGLRSVDTAVRIAAATLGMSVPR